MCSVNSDKDMKNEIIKDLNATKNTSSGSYKGKRASKIGAVKMNVN